MKMSMPKREKNIKTIFSQNVNLFYQFFINSNDARVKAILSFFGNLDGKKVIDVGCGEGRFLRVFKNKFEKINLYGLDISEKKLKFCPRGIRLVCNSMFDIRYPDNYFDCVYCVEALEHARLIEGSIKEMVRVLKPNGKIIIIDKNRDTDKFIKKILKAEAWEQWFRPKEIINLLQKYRIKATYKFIPYDRRSLLHNLFIAWEGIKAIK